MRKLRKSFKISLQPTEFGQSCRNLLANSGYNSNPIVILAPPSECDFYEIVRDI